MDFANGYTLIALSAPAWILAAMNLWLYLGGERETLLLPANTTWVAP